MSTAADSLAAILQRVARGEGSLGALVTDRTVVTSLEDIIEGVQQSGLIVDLIQRAERKGRTLRLEQARERRAED